MAKNYFDYKYFENRPDVVRVFEDLEAYHDWCRFELRNFDPSDLYRKNSENYQMYLSSKRQKKYNQSNRTGYRQRNEQNFSR